jgi:Reverse transcriptase (RNA-dependent DNA polymerase)
LIGSKAAFRSRETRRVGSLLSVDWYTSLSNSSLSKQFAVCSGVEQGSILSPTFFNACINTFIIYLKAHGVRCQIHEQYFGCLLYTDNLILLSPYVAGVQDMLNLCCETATSLDLNFNVNKCHCISFGKSSELKIEPMQIGSCEVDWCSSIKYLGVYIVSGKRTFIDIDSIKRAFCSACNCVFSQAEKIDELLHLSLQETYCLPILLYAPPGYSFKNWQLTELNSCWNTVYHKIF